MGHSSLEDRVGPVSPGVAVLCCPLRPPRPAAGPRAGAAAHGADSRAGGPARRPGESAGGRPDSRRAGAGEPGKERGWEHPAHAQPGCQAI